MREIYPQIHGLNIMLLFCDLATFLPVIIETNIVHQSDLDAKILLPVGVRVTSIFKIQDGRHAELGESGSHQKMESLGDG